MVNIKGNFDLQPVTPGIQGDFDLQPLDPNQDILGFKSKSVLGTEPKGRLAAAREAFTGSIKAGVGRLREAQESFRTGGGNIFTQPRAALKTLGGLGDIAISPFAGLTGLVQPEIEKGVGFVAERIPEPVKKQVSALIEAVPEEFKETLSDALSATGLLAIPAKGLATGVARTGARGAVGRVGEVVETGAKRTITARKEAFVESLIKPKLTKKIAEAEARRATVTGPFQKKVVQLSREEQLIKTEVAKIEGIKPGITQQKALNVISEENVKLAQTLEKQIAKNDFIFPKKELNTRLQQAKTRLAESPTLTGDAQRTADKIMNKFQQFVDEAGAKGSGLLKARKNLDRWIKGQKPKAFDAQTENAFDLALREIRQTANTFLDEKAVNVGVKESLKRQSTLFKAIENIAPKAAKEAPTAGGRAFQRLEKSLGANAKIKEIVGTIAIAGGVAGGAAAPISVTFGTLLAGKALFNAVRNPQIRVQLGKLVQELSKAQLTATGAAAGEINALKQRINEALEGSNQR